MKNKLYKTVFIILALFLMQNVTYAKPKIVTSITPIASIIAMLVQDKVELATIATTEGCPHDYHLKPSDLKTVKNADLVIYISDEFDGFTAKLMKSHNTNVVKISDIKSIKIIDDNWHFWLDLDNVKILLEELSTIIRAQFPEISNDIYSNLGKAKKEIEYLKSIKALKLSNLHNIILLSDSLEYFFLFQKDKTRLYQSYNSPQYIVKLENILNKSTKNCLILSPDKKSEFYKRFNTQIIELESENWAVDNKTIGQLFYNQYIKMIDEVSKCKIDSK